MINIQNKNRLNNLQILSKFPSNSGLRWAILQKDVRENSLNSTSNEILLTSLFH